MTETRKLFHEELADIAECVAQLGQRGIDAVEAGTEALLNGDLEATDLVVNDDRGTDDLAHSIESRVSLALATQQPVGVDLRLLVAVLRITHDLERVGDNVVNIAKATRRLYPYRFPPSIRGPIHWMRQQAMEQLRVAVEAFVERDVRKGAALRDMDAAMDQLTQELFRVLFQTVATDEAAIRRAVQIALVGRYFERIADLAVNVGERVRYMVTGEFPYEGQ